MELDKKKEKEILKEIIFDNINDLNKAGMNNQKIINKYKKV